MIEMIKDVVSKKLFKKNTLNLDDESLILSMLGIKSFNKVLFIGINKKSLIESYIVKNQYKYLNIFDPSTSKLNVYSNVYLNSFFSQVGSDFVKYYAKSEYDSNATFFKKDLRWIKYNDDTEYELEIKNEDSVYENYDLLFLALNGYELRYVKNFSNLKNQIKVVKFEFSKFNIDSRNFLKDYFMFFYEQNFICFQLSKNGLVGIKKYSTSFENDFGKIYYFVNKKFLTKINFKSSFEYRLESYVNKESN
jgi:hypothetical protein